ncbi:toprim domain-containing protein [Pedobacter sp. MC2016-24]|uniref:toprim domain-containing protein n=1 Tax=Pedobacter sp. MC2016-24 TaxID=2780090 RepID=UPI00187F969B|nr:toprim domain-containing protein [Pedobacter sp. MC2016-24]MBE9599886.1 toprim domain-containing protein [Pedobacter sp. MC2016-24]
MENLSASEIKDQVSIVGLLARLGFQPKRTSGKEVMYLSMLRESDTTPSFCVNDQLGVWFDHGSGKGGTVIDFGMAFWADLSFSEVLLKIQEVYNLSVIAEIPREPKRKRLAIKLPNYQIEEVKPLGGNQVITDYLVSRGVWNVENDLLREIYYYVEDEKKLRKHFFAVGWMNELKGWEVRNKYFKGCLGSKSLTLIERDTSSLVLFEGYMNYLSWRLEHPDANHSVIVLNSLTTLVRAIKIASSFSSVEVYFDHDQAGRKATSDFIGALKETVDGSVLYLGYNDYNEKLINELREAKQNASRFTQHLDSLFSK